MQPDLLAKWVNISFGKEKGERDNLLISVGLAGGGGAEPLLAGNGTNGVMGENGTMSNTSVGVFEDMLFPCKYEQCMKYISNLRNHSFENYSHLLKLKNKVHIRVYNIILHYTEYYL